MPRSRTAVAPSPRIEQTDADSPYAAAPTRATGNLLLTFGDRVVPCSVFAGTEDNGVKRSEYVVTSEGPFRLGRKTVIKEGPHAGDEVDSSAVVKMVESDRGLVPLSDDEIAQAVGCEGGLAEVEAFLPLSVMTSGQYIIDSLYQLRPAPPSRGRDRTRRSEATEKAFALVIKAMRLEGVFALVKVALRGKPRYAAFMPDGRLYTLRFQNEVRLPLPMPDTSDLSNDDVMLARMMVVSKSANIAPDLTDTATESVREFVENKAQSILPEPADIPRPDRSYEDMIAGLRAMVTGMALPTGPAVPTPAARARIGRNFSPPIYEAESLTSPGTMIFEYVASPSPLSREWTIRPSSVDPSSVDPIRPSYVTDSDF